MAINISGYLLNRAGDPAPWGPTEDQFHNDIIAKVGPKAGTPCSHEGHVHNQIVSSGNGSIISVDDSGRLIFGALTEGTVGICVSGTTLLIQRYESSTWVTKIPFEVI
jgi:hypothetical protein